MALHLESSSICKLFLLIFVFFVLLVWTILHGVAVGYDFGDCASFLHHEFLLFVEVLNVLSDKHFLLVYLLYFKSHYVITSSIYPHNLALGTQHDLTLLFHCFFLFKLANQQDSLRILLKNSYFKGAYENVPWLCFPNYWFLFTSLWTICLSIYEVFNYRIVMFTDEIRHQHVNFSVHHFVLLVAK